MPCRKTLLALLLYALAAPLQAAPFTLYLVRHAEKAAGADPTLSEAGHVRAGHLADLLSSAKVQQVWTSEFRRTRQTAAPLARRLGVEPVVYDPRDLETVARRLKQAGATALVVGHSNTTPQLVRALGGTAEDMAEWCYDRVYQLRMAEAGAVETRLLHLPPLSPEPDSVTQRTNPAPAVSQNSGNHAPKTGTSEDPLP